MLAGIWLKLMHKRWTRSPYPYGYRPLRPPRPVVGRQPSDRIRSVSIHDAFARGCGCYPLLTSNERLQLSLPGVRNEETV